MSAMQACHTKFSLRCQSNFDPRPPRDVGSDAAPAEAMRYMLWAGSTRGFSKRLGAEIAKLQPLADDERLCAAARVAVRTLLWQHAQGWPPVQPVVRRPPEEQSVADEEEDGEDVKDEAGETTPPAPEPGDLRSGATLGWGRDGPASLAPRGSRERHLDGSSETSRPLSAKESQLLRASHSKASAKERRHARRERAAAGAER